MSARLRDTRLCALWLNLRQIDFQFSWPLFTSSSSSVQMSLTLPLLGIKSQLLNILAALFCPTITNFAAFWYWPPPLPLLGTSLSLYYFWVLVIALLLLTTSHKLCYSWPVVTSWAHTFCANPLPEMASETENIIRSRLFSSNIRPIFNQIISELQILVPSGARF